jgi:hypothetical protein
VRVLFSSDKALFTYVQVLPSFNKALFTSAQGLSSTDKALFSYQITVSKSIMYHLHKYKLGLYLISFFYHIQQFIKTLYYRRTLSLGSIDVFKCLISKVVYSAAEK